MGHEPRLDEETELALARRWRDAGDHAARDALVRAHAGLVRRIVKRFSGYRCPESDLIQEGSIGLLHALDRYDPERGVRISTYATWWIRAHVLRYVERNTGLVRGATTSDRLRLFYNLGRVEHELQAKGSPTTSDAIADELGVREKDVVDMKLLRRPVTSLEGPAPGSTDERSAGMAERVGNGEEDPESSCATAELSERLEDALERFALTLSGRNLEMFNDRLAANNPASLQEFSRRWNVTRQVARRVERRVAIPLRRFLYKEMGDTITAALGAA